MGGDRYLSPRILQYIGIALLVASAVFWALTRRESLLLMTSAMTLIGVGSYEAAFRTLLNRQLDEEQRPYSRSPSTPASEQSEGA